MKYSSTRKQHGSIVIDSLIALALLGSVLTSWVIFNQVNYNRKIAKKLAAETTDYARMYAKYMNDNYANLLKDSKNNPAITLTPSDIIDSQNDLAQTNIFKQTPCVTILANKNTGDLEAVMYYVGGQNTNTRKYAMIVHQALILLGSKGGLFLNGVITGNSGWSVEQSSEFLTNSNQCGNGRLANNSLAINIDLMNQWNQDTQPYLAIAKEEDDGLDIRKKPGHMLNYNTSKSDITISQGAGVILDNTANNQIKLKMDYGNGTAAATVGLFTNNPNLNTTTLADTLEPVQTGVAGESCDTNEIGKVIADRGNNSTANVLNRSNLICSQNQMMCANVNASATCYLPTQSNNVVFRNTSLGIQSDSGNFICPKEIPFAIGVNTSRGDANGIKIIQGNLSGYIVNIGYTITVSGTLIIQATCSNMPDFTINAIPN